MDRNNLPPALPAPVRRPRIFRPLLLCSDPHLADLVDRLELVLDFADGLPAKACAHLLALVLALRAGRRLLDIATRLGLLLELTRFALVILAELVERLGPLRLIVLPLTPARAQRTAAVRACGLRLADARQAHAALGLPLIEATAAVRCGQFDAALGLDELHVVRTLACALDELLLCLVPAQFAPLVLLQRLVGAEIESNVLCLFGEGSTVAERVSVAE